MEKLKNNLKGYFSSVPKAIFVVMLALMVVTIGITATRKTIIVSIDGKEMKIVTFRNNVKSVLDSNSIALGAKDKITPSVDTKVKKESKINIKRAVNVQVAVDGKELNISTAENTIGEMLDAEGIYVEDFDRISPSSKDPIIEGLTVTITRIESKMITENKTIDFSTVVKNDDESEKGVKKVLQQGELGEKTVSTRVIYEDGKEVSRTVVREVVKKQPVQKIVAMGTLSAITPSRGETKVLYKDSLRVKATAYSGGNERTATGTRARRVVGGYSTVAVDPRVIPLGTKLYVEGYGYAIAEDTGGAIKGNIIDIYVNSESEAYTWGVKYVNVYILK